MCVAFLFSVLDYSLSFVCLLVWPISQRIHGFAEYPAFPTVMDVNQIREILPHRYVRFTAIVTDLD